MKEILTNYKITKIGQTIIIDNQYFLFSFTKADSIVKQEYKGKYRYFGGLQCNFHHESHEHKTLESLLCDIAELLVCNLNNG